MRRVAYTVLLTTVALVLLLLNSGVFAQEGRRGDTMGAGVSTCGRFAEAYRRNPNRAEEFYFSWAQGFMSGLNAAARSANTEQNLLTTLKARNVVATGIDEQMRVISGILRQESS